MTTTEFTTFTKEQREKKSFPNDYINYYIDFLKKYESSETFMPLNDLYKNYEYECMRREVNPLNYSQFSKKVKQLEYKIKVVQAKRYIAIRKKEYSNITPYISQLETA